MDNPPPLMGFLNLNKPLHWTSHDCVAKVRRLLQQRKVGHGGTLDPLATGVLPMAVGRATRLLPYLSTTKVYQALIRFGLRTDSDDLAGAILAEQNASRVTLAVVESVLPEFRGTIPQIPPKFSAIQVQGKRLYELARAGIACDVPQRTVTITELTITHFQPGEKAELGLTITCGEGTYIRSLARDLGDRLGVGATLAGLERRWSGGMSLAQSVTPEMLEQRIAEQQPPPLASPNQVLRHHPAVTLTGDLIQRWQQGQRLLLTDIPIGIVRVETEQEDCLGMALVTAEPTGRVLRPKVVLS